ncbi:hypothetical protein LEL_06483 [Akanthomyces lecanii RCEF 1005]|uniref:DUF1772-domain-containing protein n=1 Tax=Akanthomyces lecanii RCEF 1005 TaxID=1081108 RepID=A0A168GQW3_CORDF|nr:hypothetical protein LEL_06483 [Akanthomyces lecanii RCEF 1005]
MPDLNSIVQVTAVALPLFASGGIATLSAFDVPLLQAQPASRSLPSIRWLFSRGSHIFPTAAFVSGASLLQCAYRALPPAHRFTSLNSFTKMGPKTNLLLAAAGLALSIGPFTQIFMIPLNFSMIKKNEELGGFRSEKAMLEAKNGKTTPTPGSRSASDSVAGKGEGDEFTDLTGPHASTARDSTPEEDREMRDRLGQFARLNSVRAVLIGAGGLLGLVATTL